MVQILKKLILLILIASPCYGQLLDLTTHAQGGGSQDAVLQGGTTTPVWLSLSTCTAITYNATTHAFACVPAADASHNGYLTSTDWSTFNGKQPAGSYALQSTTLTATSPLTGGGDLSANRSFGCQTASGSQAGCLSSTDWTTFNNKGSGSVTSIATTGPITGGTITSSGTIACPTCVLGPNTGTLGGFIGTGYSHSAAAGQHIAWFANNQTSNLAFPFPVSVWIGGQSAYASGAVGAGAQNQFGIGEQFGSPTLTAVQASMWGILNVAAATTYSDPNVAPVYFSASSVTDAINESVTTSGAAFKGQSAAIFGTNVSILGNNLNAGTVAASTTVTSGFSMSNTTANSTGNETLVAVPMPWASGGTAQGFCVYNTSSNGVGGALTGTLRRAAAASVNSFSNTSITWTVSAGTGGNQTTCDTSHTQAYSQFDAFTMTLANANAGAVSGGIAGISLGMTPLGSSTYMVIFGSNSVAFPNAGTTYGQGFTNTQSTTETSVRQAAPRSFTAKVLACYVTTAPLVASETVTLVQNGTAGALTITIPVGQSVPAVISDTTPGHAMSFTGGIVNPDSFDLKYTNGAGGTAAAISSCVISD